MGLPNRGWPSDSGMAIRVANESRNQRMAFRFFIVIADLQPPYNGIALHKFQDCAKMPRGRYLENIVSREVFENRNSFILGRS